MAQIFLGPLVAIGVILGAITGTVVGAVRNGGLMPGGKINRRAEAAVSLGGCYGESLAAPSAKVLFEPHESGLTAHGFSPACVDYFVREGVDSGFEVVKVNETSVQLNGDRDSVAIIWEVLSVAA
jgi:hypothetical protein